MDINFLTVAFVGLVVVLILAVIELLRPQGDHSQEISSLRKAFALMGVGVMCLAVNAIGGNLERHEL
ncbi:hypothetical protein [Nitrosomonas sp. Nm33]|uniref:hypothetical protein n=1 Tax=Nitrosomonas sp. Nm33 TaxID=133724 RepID=UPI00089B8650|nr:hypothetical protein [Nitrosomonas sp. Nm33]SDY50804.1 hypothetical protein SAMN05421755_102641 [Nitrosomonas sp. Nm33]